LTDFYEWVNLAGYTKALDVVFIISFGKLFSMSMGCLNNIITNSKYYHYVFLFSTTSAVLAILLNIYFIKLYGIIGAAYATLIVMVLINLMKILLVQFTFKINPFGKKTLLILLVIFSLHLIFSHIDLDFPPIISLALRSLLIGLLFSFISYLLKLTEDFQIFLTNLISFKKKF
jgi:O-antigen/teichoic acid export membrane protein